MIRRGSIARSCALAISSMLALTIDAEAAMAPSAIDASTPALHLASGGCGVGLRRTASGHCVHEALDRRHCQPGMHAVSFPNGKGYRCVVS
jgi:hypothetical protein